MPTESFFTESSEQSKIKTAIVSKYFWAWAKVIMPWAKKSGGKIAYIDLFAGPGRYEDGTRSTPLYILEAAIKDADMSRMLVATFNDADLAKTNSLQAAIDALPSIDKLKFKPNVMNKVVGTEMAELFEHTKLAPTLFFVDPWGYQGLSLRLVNSVLKDWGCDCIFFFNYNRINMGLSNNLLRLAVEVHALDQQLKQVGLLAGHERVPNRVELRQRRGHVLGGDGGTVDGGDCTLDFSQPRLDLACP